MKSIKKEVTLIADKTWLISDYYLDNYFLVVGDQKAALIDTGCGIGNVLDEVKEITDLPLEVLLTHGHLDHCGGMLSIDSCYMHPDDECIAREHYNKPDMIKWYIETRVPVRFPGEGHVEALTAMVSDEEHPFFNYKPIKDGDTWDLGGRILEALHTPGHSAGSVCYLDKTNRILFSGDTVNIGIIILNKPEGTEKELAIYRDSIARIWSRQEEFDKLAIGHDGGLIDKGIVKDYLDLANGILEGSIVGQYEEVGIRKGVVARLGAAELWYRCDA